MAKTSGAPQDEEVGVARELGNGDRTRTHRSCRARRAWPGPQLPCRARLAPGPGASRIVAARLPTRSSVGPAFVQQWLDSIQLPVDQGRLSNATNPVRGSALATPCPMPIRRNIGCASLRDGLRVRRPPRGARVPPPVQPRRRGRRADCRSRARRTRPCPARKVRSGSLPRPAKPSSTRRGSLTRSPTARLRSLCKLTIRLSHRPALIQTSTRRSCGSRHSNPTRAAHLSHHRREPGSRAGHWQGKILAFVGPDSCDTGIPTGCYGNEVTAINVWGTSVGNFMDNRGNFVGHGLIRHADGRLTTFDAPGAGTGTDQGTSCPGCVSGLNAWGAIAGTYIDSNSVQHGFLRSPNGEFTTFDAPGAGTGSYQGTGCPSDCPTSLNNSGAIVGTYIDSNFVFHGYLRTPDGNTVTVDPLGSVFTWSSGMNGLGTITGYYLDANSVTHGFLRIPRED